MSSTQLVMSGNTEFRDAKRKQESILSGLEKRTLIWLANRMPQCINSDHLTALGSIAMLLAGLSYWMSRWNKNALLLATFWLAVNWFGDSLDGTVARVRSHQRPRYGFYVDHVIDSFGAVFLLGGLALSGYMSTAIAVGLLIVFLMFSIEVYLATYTLGSFHLSHCKFSPTELRILLAIGNLALLFRPMVLGGKYRLFDVGGLAGIVGMALLLAVAVVQHTVTLYREEPLP